MDSAVNMDESAVKEAETVSSGTQKSVGESVVSSVGKPEERQRTGQAKLVKKIPKSNMKQTLGLIIGVLSVVLAGVGTGWALSGGMADTERPTASEVVPGVKESETEAGIADESTFRDSAEGILVEGGIDGEGTHHIDRGLGVEKNVYLTSTVIDLQSFVGKKVMVWGETISARHAGWLMDVGKIKVVE